MIAWAPRATGSLLPDGHATATTSVLSRDEYKEVDLVAQTIRSDGTTYVTALILGTLPAGFRPLQTLVVPVLTYGSGSLNYAVIAADTGLITLTAASPAGHTVAQITARFRAA